MKKVRKKAVAAKMVPITAGVVVAVAAAVVAKARTIKASDELRRANRMNRCAAATRFRTLSSAARCCSMQVVKEERGNKGAALTTYLSLAGRYCVSDAQHQRTAAAFQPQDQHIRVRPQAPEVHHFAEMNLPATMGCIVRTAGLERTRT